MILDTERLFLREMKQNDFQDLAEILQNPRVMYAYEHDFSDNDVQAWLDRQIERYKKYGFGLAHQAYQHLTRYKQRIAPSESAGLNRPPSSRQRKK